MLIRLLSCLCMLTCLLAAPTFAQTTLPLGKQVVSFDDHGTWQLLDDQGRVVASAQTLFYAKGWRTTSQNQDTITKTGEMTWQGIMLDRHSKINSQFTQTVTQSDTAITIHLKVVPEEAIPVEDVPMVVMFLPAALHDGSELSIGKTYKLPTNNKWGYGGNLKLGLTGNTIKLDHAVSMSVWKKGKDDTAKYEVRVKLDGEKRSPGKTITGPYELTLTLQQVTDAQASANTAPNQPIAFVGQVDVLETDKKKTLTPHRDPQAEYLTNYQRVLSEPTAAVFDHTVARNWIKQGLANRSNNVSAQEQIDAVETYLQSLSLAYDLHSRQAHAKLFTQLVEPLDTRVFDTACTQVYDNLKAGSITSPDLALSALKLGETLEKQAISKFGDSYYPGQTPNVHSWVKALYLNGYTKHRDGLNSGEPYPWHVSWDTGLSLSLLGEKSVYTVDRTWTTNTWHNRKTGIEMFVSILSPVMLLENVQTLSLDALSSPVTHLLTPGRKVLLLAGQTSPITMPTLEQNWFALRTGKGVLLCFTGRQPTALQTTSNQLSLNWPGKTFLAILNLPATISTEDIAKQADFWGNIVLALPMQAVELTSQNQTATVTYRYDYRMQTSDWPITPRHVAPVPHLAALSHDATFAAHALGGNDTFTYIDGKDASWSTQSIAMQPMYRGLNDDAKHLIKPGRAQHWVDLGATSVRVCIYTQDNEQDGYDLIKGALEQCSKVGLKVLIDPHDFIYATNRNGLPTRKDATEQFVTMWENLATLSQPFGDTVIGYDLYNELRLKTHEWDKWQPIAEKAIARIRSIDRTTPIYVGSTDMSNATGYHATKKIIDANVIYSFHHYAMHSFTHQNIFQHNPREAYVFYPGWTPLIDWGANQTYGDVDLLWWDRWSMPASIWPALRFSAQNKVFLHCGEFAPVGWSRPAAADASMIWTVDAMAMLEQRNIVWHLWNKGFGLVIPEVKDKVTQIWQTRNTPFHLPR